MRHRLRTASAVLGTLLLAGCGTSTVPGSAYHSVVVNALSSKAPSATASPSSASSAASAGRTVLSVRRTPLGYVLANGSGFTIYWIAQSHSLDPKAPQRIQKFKDLTTEEPNASNSRCSFPQSD